MKANPIVKLILLFFLTTPFYFNCADEAAIAGLVGASENEVGGDEENQEAEKVAPELPSPIVGLPEEEPIEVEAVEEKKLPEEAVVEAVVEIAVPREVSLSPIDLSDLDLAVNRPGGVALAKVGERDFLFFLDSDGENASGRTRRNRVSVLEVMEDGTLTRAYSVTNSPKVSLEGVWGVTTAEVGENVYLFVGRLGNGVRGSDGVSVFRVEDDGELVLTDDVKDERHVGKEDVGKALTTAQVNGKTFLFAGGFGNRGLSVFRVKDDGELRVKQELDDPKGMDNSLQITDPWGMTTVEVGGETLLLVTGHNDHGFSALKVAGNGRLSSVTNVRDESDEDFLLTRPTGITTEVVGGTTFLFVAARGDSDTDEDCGLNVFRLEEAGGEIKVINVTNFSHMPNDEGASGEDNAAFHGIWNITADEVQGEHYLFVTQDNDMGNSGIGVFLIEESGNLVKEKFLTDGHGAALERPYDVAAKNLGGEAYLFLTELHQTTISAFRFNP